jgi:hypothetical protein
VRALLGSSPSVGLVAALTLAASAVSLSQTKAPASGALPAYEVARTSAEPAQLLDGDEAWSKATPIEWGPAEYVTRFRALWSEVGLYLRFDATDPRPWHTMTRRDEHLWDEEVVEIFLDLDRSGRDYYELEINPANVVCDLRMISPWPDKKGDIDWNLAGLATRARKAGSGWTAAAFLPWEGLRSLPSAKKVELPPRPGVAFRFNVFRIDRPGGKQSPEKDAVFAAWSKPQAPTFHDASAFRDFAFVAEPR